MNTNFIESEELKDLANKLKDYYYLHLGHVDLEKIYFAEKVAEEMPKKATTIEVLGITQVQDNLGEQNTFELHEPSLLLWLMFRVLFQNLYLI